MFTTPKRLPRTAAGGLVALAGTAAMFALVATPGASGDGYESLPDEIVLTGIVRDFKEKTVAGGHPDFEQRPASGFGLYAGNVWPGLGLDGKPVFIGGGRKVASQARDSGGDPIAYQVANTSYIDGADGNGLPDFMEALIEDDEGTPAIVVKLGRASLNSDGTTTISYDVSEMEGGKNLSRFTVVIPDTLDIESLSPSSGTDIDHEGDSLVVEWAVSDSFDAGTFTMVIDGHFLCDDRLNSVKINTGTQETFTNFVAPTDTPAEGIYALPVDEIMAVQSMGDTGANTSGTDQGAIFSRESFEQWFTDTPGVNISMSLPITLVRQSGTNVYVFDDKIDPYYDDLGGFFPINNLLFGNSPGNNKNFHFTYELSTEFIYQPGEGNVFTFTGDDDVWVFINGRLVIDLGGVHSATSQTVEIDRYADILRAGQSNTLHFFFAERHRTQSNFRIETSLKLKNANLPTSAHIYD